MGVWTGGDDVEVIRTTAPWSAVRRLLWDPWCGGPAVGAVVGVGAAAIGVLGTRHSHPYPWLVWLPLQVAGLSFTTAGTVAWLRQPANRTGALMIAVGITWYLGDLQLSTHRALFAVGFCLFYLVAAVFTHLVLALPDGRLTTRAERLVVVGLYVAVILPQVLWYLRDPSPAAHIWGGVRKGGYIWPAVGSVSSGVLTLAAFGLVLRRWQTAASPSRRTLAALWSTGAVAGVVAIVATVADLRESSVAVLEYLILAFALVLTFTPFAILTGLVRVRLSRVRVARLVQQLETSSEPVRVRDALAAAVGDPMLQVCFLRPDSSGYVDVHGNPAVVPPVDGRAVTFVDRQGTRLAALLHDPALTDQRPLVDAVVATARLALENARLHAAQAAQLAEVRASRARIVAATDAERRRIQRDLHDGAQQNLLATALLIGQAREELPPDDKATACPARLLHQAGTQLHDIIRELRELTEGLDPPALTEQGLAAVVDTLAERAPLPVVYTIPSRRWPGLLERTAYFVIHEALSNIYKHAHAQLATITVEDTDTTLMVRITDDGDGTADPGRGGGLRGLRDRVATVGGTLSLDSRPGTGTVIEAQLPCK